MDYLDFKCSLGFGLAAFVVVNGTMVTGVILNVLMGFVLAAAHYGRPSLALLLGISAVISIAGLIVSTVSGSKAGPILVIIGCVFFLPLALIAGLGAQKALNAMKRQAA